MTKTIPTEINLRQKSRQLDITFDNGDKFSYTCEFLRVNSPSAEVQGHGPGQGTLQLGKEKVNIEKIEPVGNYAVCLYFDDGHHTGIYSWEYLHKLGVRHADYWQDYLDRLVAAGHPRKSATPQA
jgi:DUF971 family protein